MRKLSSVVSGRCSTLTLQYIRSIVGLFLEATTPFSVNTPALMTRMYPIDSRPRREEFTIYFYDPCSACWTWMAWVPVGMYLGIFSIEGSRFENVDIFNTACPVVAPVSRSASSTSPLGSIQCSKRRCYHHFHQPLPTLRYTK